MEKFVFQMNLDVHSSDHALRHSLIIHRDQVVNTVEVCWFWDGFFGFYFVCLVWFLSGLAVSCVFSYWSQGVLERGAWAAPAVPLDTLLSAGAGADSPNLSFVLQKRILESVPQELQMELYFKRHSHLFICIFLITIRPFCCGFKIKKKERSRQLC